MGRRSIIRRLPKSLRDEIHARLEAGDTIDELHSRIKGAGVQISRTSVGLYAQNYAKLGVHLRELREVATAFRRDLGDAAEGDAGRLLIEMVHTLAFKAAAGGMESEPLDSKQIANFARAVASLARARKSGVDTVVVLKEKLRLGLEKVEQEVKANALTAAEVFERAKAIVRGTF